MKKIREFFDSMLKSTAGFTMIELLIVISIIGVLAVAVLSSINPIEQINKSRDTRTRTDAANIINAADRYFAIHEVYPWNETTTSYTTADADYSSEFVFTGSADDWDWVDILVTTAEVKEGYTNRLKNDDSLTIFKPAISNATMYACFIPRSEAFKFEAARNCNDGTTPGGLGAVVSPPSGVTTCNSTDGEIDDLNQICLP